MMPRVRGLKQTPAALETRRLARARLDQLGYSESAMRGADGLIAAVEAESGRSADGNPQALLDAWVGVKTAPERPRYVGEVVPPRDRNKLRGHYTPVDSYLSNVERARRAQPRTRPMVSNARHDGGFD